MQLWSEVECAACLTHVHTVYETVSSLAVQLLRQVRVICQQKTGAHEIAAYRRRHPAVLLVVFVRGDEVPHPSCVGHEAAVRTHAQQLDVLIDALALFILALDNVEVSKTQLLHK